MTSKTTPDPRTALGVLSIARYASELKKDACLIERVELPPGEMLLLHALPMSVDTCIGWNGCKGGRGYGGITMKAKP